jgi:hypothetical protein
VNNWHDLTYLHAGTPRQRAAWEAIHRLGIMERLQAYQPVLAGTIPLDIDVADSDLDVICCASDLDAFDRFVRDAFGRQDGFSQQRCDVNGVPSSVTSFWHGGFAFELFAQPVPADRQNAYRHMVMEARLLALSGEQAREGIRELKRNGMKTEPAFARYFGIPGDDPYQALLEWERYSDAELAELIQKRT